MSRVDRMLQRAQAVALTSTNRVKHGAVIAHGNRVLAVGVNARRVDPTQCSDPARESDFHAEVAAIRSLRTGTEPANLTMYVARVGHDGGTRLSKPCPECAQAIKDFGIRRVLWT